MSKVNGLVGRDDLVAEVAPMPDVTVQTPSNRRGSQEPKALILRPLPPRGGGLGWGG